MLFRSLGLLAAGCHVIAVEIDEKLARQLPITIADRRPGDVERLDVVHADALRVEQLPQEPTALVANLPYNVAVPVVLHLLATFPSIERGLVMVQAEVADRLVASPGDVAYGVPSAKLAWFAAARGAGRVSASVFWPVPRVESGLVAFTRGEPPREAPTREQVFAVIDAAFSQRRKTLRSALATWAGSRQEVERILADAGVDPSARGESLDIQAFARIAEAGQRRA